MGVYLSDLMKKVQTLIETEVVLVTDQIIVCLFWLFKYEVFFFLFNVDQRL